MIPGASQFGNVAKKVGGYVGNIAQNVHDVGTALATNIKVGTTPGALKTVYDNDPVNKAASNNLTNQVKEVGGALLGKSGTRSDQYNKNTGYVSGSKLKK
jgi:hypothetical protein